MPPKPFEIYRRLLREHWQDNGCNGSHRKLSKGGKIGAIDERIARAGAGSGTDESEVGMRYMYPAVFTENELGGYSVCFVDFDNGYTCGDDMEDAVAMASEVLWLLIDDCLQLDKPLPKPTYPPDHEGLLVVVSADVDTERGMLTTRMAASMLGVESDTSSAPDDRLSKLASKK